MQNGLTNSLTCVILAVPAPEMALFSFLNNFYRVSICLSSVAATDAA